MPGAPGFSLSASAFALAGFLIGAALGGRLTSRVGHDRALHVRATTGNWPARPRRRRAGDRGDFPGDPAASHGTLHLTTLHLTTVHLTTVHLMAGHSGAGSAPVAYLVRGHGRPRAGAGHRDGRPELGSPQARGARPRHDGAHHDAHRHRSRLPVRPAGDATLARRLLAVAVMLGGGILGAWLVLQVSATAALTVAAGVLLVATARAVLAARGRRRRGGRRPAPAPA